jgi:hypothetical protein
MAQTAYTQDPAVAAEGMLADLSNNVILTAIASEVIPFGRAIARIAPLAGAPADERPPRCRLTAAAGDITGGIFLGISLSDVTTEKPVGAAESTGWQLNESVRYLRSGRMWVIPEEIVAFGDAVWARHTADAAPDDELGALRNAASGGAGAALQLYPRAAGSPGGALFQSATAAAFELAVIEINP